MGMFDYIECHYPLPGNVPDWAKTANPTFQTKDMEDCWMDTYIITRSGTLDGHPDFTGTINFYNSNVVASGPGLYTANGEDAWDVGYRAVFVDGGIVSITETENERRPATKSPWRKQVPPTEEDIEARKRRRDESLVGKRIYTLWGTETIGRYVTVIAENSTEFICQHEDGEFETISRYQRDNCFFDSEAEALAHIGGWLVRDGRDK